MTISNPQVRAQYVGDGSSTSFPIPFPFYLSTDITVLVGNAVQGSGYSITGGEDANGNPQTGTVVFSSAPANSVAVQFILDVPLSQLVSLVDGTSFPSKTLNQVNDRAIQAAMRLSDLLDRTILAPDGDVSPNLSLPAATSRANTYLAFDANGNLSVAQSVPSGTLSQSSIGFFLQPQTAAETSANIIPANYAYPPGDIRRYGGIDDNSTDNAAAINKAISVGGTIVFPVSNTGIYRTSGSHVLADGVSFVGKGMRTGSPFYGSGLKYTGTGTMITCLARNTISDLEISTTLSAAPAGATATVGVSWGNTATNAGQCKLLRCRVINFHIGLQNGGGLWCNAQDCAITNNDYGLAFNMSGSTTSNACTYLNNEIGFNGRGGVIGLSVPVRMNGQTFIGGSIEGNCQENTAIYTDQVNMGPVGFFCFLNVYFEYAAGGTPPNSINLQQAGQGSIENSVFFTGATHIRDSVGGACSQIKICNCRFVSATVADINLPSETDVIAFDNLNASTVTITGSGCRNLPTGSGLASWPNLTTSWTPTIIGSSTAGSPTYSVRTGFYSKVGNVVTFSVRVSIITKTGISGAISIEGLPVPTGSVGIQVFAAEMSGVTLSGSNTYFYAELAQGSTSLLLMQGGSTAAAQLVDTNLGASTTVIVSGSYQATS